MISHQFFGYGRWSVFSWSDIRDDQLSFGCIWRWSVISWLDTVQSRIRKCLIFICFCTRVSHRGHPLLLTSLPELYGLHQVEMSTDFWRTCEASLQPRQEPSTPQSSNETHQHVSVYKHFVGVRCALWWSLSLDIAFTHNLLFDMAFWCKICSVWSVVCSVTKLTCVWQLYKTDIDKCVARLLQQRVNF